jgi:hypothetical protein
MDLHHGAEVTNMTVRTGASRVKTDRAVSLSAIIEASMSLIGEEGYDSVSI